MRSGIFPTLIKTILTKRRAIVREDELKLVFFVRPLGISLHRPGQRKIYVAAF